MPELMAWRGEVIENVFGCKPSEELMAANESYYRKHIANDTHVAFVAEFNGKKAGCGSLCLEEELPSPDNPTGKCAYLMNIYVREEFRENGLGHHIVNRLVQEAKIRGCKKIYLETTPEGRPLYQSLGFRDLPDMMKLKSIY